MTTVQLFSGGMDSVLIHHLIKPDVTLYVDLGTAICKREYDGARCMGFEMTHVSFPNIHEYTLENEILPGRNSFFVLLAAQYGERIVLGATAGDTTKDKDSTWACMMTDLLRHTMTKGKSPLLVPKPEKYHVALPFCNLTKAELLARYLHRGGDKFMAIRSYSCYTGNIVECGRCRACLRKYVALRMNEISTACFHHHPSASLPGLLEYSTHAGRDEKELIEIESVVLMDGVKV